MRIRKCPRCGIIYTDFPAISRRDNKTPICPHCGTLEALEDLSKKTYEGPVYWHGAECPTKHPNTKKPPVLY